MRLKSEDNIYVLLSGRYIFSDV